jgi:hypothetical protein
MIALRLAKEKGPCHSDFHMYLQLDLIPEKVKKL